MVGGYSLPCWPPALKLPLFPLTRIARSEDLQFFGQCSPMGEHAGIAGKSVTRYAACKYVQFPDFCAPLARTVRIAIACQRECY